LVSKTTRSINFFGSMLWINSVRDSSACNFLTQRLKSGVKLTLKELTCLPSTYIRIRPQDSFGLSWLKTTSWFILTKTSSWKKEKRWSTNSF
jgi:hypothetical protein